MEKVIALMEEIYYARRERPPILIVMNPMDMHAIAKVFCPLEATNNASEMFGIPVMWNDDLPRYEFRCAYPGDRVGDVIHDFYSFHNELPSRVVVGSDHADAPALFGGLVCTDTRVRREAIVCVSRK